MFDREGSRKYLNDNERRAYLHAIQTEPDKARKTFCLTLFYAGCRISEALNVVPERIDLSQMCIVFETLKRRRGGVFRAVPIPDHLADLLRDVLKNSDPGTKVWQFSRSTAYRMVKQRMAQAGVGGGMASPKGLRHGFAVACVTKNIPLTAVQKWLGHARLETTALYLSVSGDEERKLAQRLWITG